jgi:hypothetical protein
MLLGAAMIALIWTGITFTLAQQGDDASQDALRDASNFARAFDEHVSWAIQEVDQAIIFLRAL